MCIVEFTNKKLRFITDVTIRILVPVTLNTLLYNRYKFYNENTLKHFKKI